MHLYNILEKYIYNVYPKELFPEYWLTLKELISFIVLNMKILSLMYNNNSNIFYIFIYEWRMYDDEVYIIVFIIFYNNAIGS